MSINPQLKGPHTLWIVSSYSKLEGPQKIVDSESIPPFQGPQKNMDCESMRVHIPNSMGFKKKRTVDWEVLFDGFLTFVRSPKKLSIVSIDK